MITHKPSKRKVKIKALKYEPDVEHCNFCEKERNGKWALLFSPPEDDKVTKHHICPECYEAIISCKLCYAHHKFSEVGRETPRIRMQD